jgi:CubicO group peptidase (beta-lactamase class C family)
MRLNTACLWIGLGLISCLSSASADEVSRQLIWPRSSPGDVNISADLPDTLRTALSSNRRLLSFGLVRDGKQIIEHCQGGAAQESYANIASATKSVVAILVGIALDRKVITSVDRPLSDFFPELNGPDVDPLARGLTLRHLLSMSAGWQSSPLICLQR